MNTALWVVAAVLAVGFAAGGASLLVMDKNHYRALGPNQHWVDDFSRGHLTAIGALKLSGAAGLVLPAVFGVEPVLVAAAATGLTLFMAGAATTRFRRNEWLYMSGDVVFLCACAFVAWGRFTLEPFT